MCIGAVACIAQPASVMLAASDFGLAHVILVVFTTLGGSQATEIAQLNFRSGFEALSDHGSVSRAINIDLEIVF